MRAAVFLALVLTLSWSVGCGHQHIQPQKPTPKQKTLKVMTFNVNYGIAGDSSTLKAIADADADVVLLQETTAPWQTAMQQLRQQYPYQAFKHCCLAGGLGVLSKYPVADKDYVQAPKPGWFPAWRVIVASPLGNVQMLNVHLRPPVNDEGSFVRGYFSTPEIRKKEIQAHVKTLESGMPTIIAGDFNENASGDAVEVLESKELYSVLPQFHGDQPTWRWPTRWMTLRAQLDHIVYDRRVLKPLKAKVIHAGRSDHYPVVATFTTQTSKGFKHIKHSETSSLSN